MNQLPRHFTKGRFSLPRDQLPRIVIDLGRAPVFDPQAAENIAVGVVLFHNCWLEFKHFGLWAVTSPNKPFSDGAIPSTSLRVFEHGRFTDRYDVGDVVKRFIDYDISAPERVSMFLASMAYLSKQLDTAQRQLHEGVCVDVRLKAKIYEREAEDSVRYVTIQSLADLRTRPVGYVEPDAGASGIRKREHDVRGHWRTYKSGVRVWVRSHIRGDRALGRVTRVLTV